MRVRRRIKILALAAMGAVIALAVANVYECGHILDGHVWVCSDCQVKLCYEPGKRVKYLVVPATYQAHNHTWRAVHWPPRWSPWKPWHWLVCAMANAEVLKQPDPAALFRIAGIFRRDSEEEGLLRLSKDPQYLLADDAAALFKELTSRPE